MARPTSSSDAIANASKSQADLSSHGDAIGAAGVKETNFQDVQDLLDKNGESGIISPPSDGFGKIHVGLAWNNIVVEQSSGFMGLIKKATKQGVDLDLGCFFELTDGTRGVLQPFGNLFGQYDQMPYIQLSGDERTGDSDGDDEYLTINGKQWPKIKRILIYTYIYEGAKDWSQIKPEISVNLNGGLDDDDSLVIRPRLKTSDLTVCAIASIKNVKNGMQLVTHGEYFHSHASMDRAFGFGLKWEDGAKD
jgi:tellurite resistance protein TerA